MRLRHFLLTLLLGSLATGSEAWADAFSRASQKYKSEIEQLTVATSKALEKLAESASEASQLEVIRSQQATFEREGIIPTLIDASLRQSWETSCEKMERAYWSKIARLPQSSQDEVDELKLAQAAFRKEVGARGLVIWTYLFDGRSTDGWAQGENRGSWRVEKGMLQFDGEKHRGGGNLLVTDRSDYRNFHLRVRMRVTAGYSCYVAGRFEPGRYDDGPGYRVYVPGPAVDEEFKQKLGELWNRKKEIREGIARAPNKSAIIQLELVVDGNQVRVLIDDREISSVVDKDKDAPSQGAIALRGARETVAQFLSVELKELPDDRVSEASQD